MQPAALTTPNFRRTHRHRLLSGIYYRAIAPLHTLSISSKNTPPRPEQKQSDIALTRPMRLFEVSYKARTERHAQYHQPGFFVGPSCQTIPNPFHEKIKMGLISGNSANTVLRTRGSREQCTRNELTGSSALGACGGHPYHTGQQANPRCCWYWWLELRHQFPPLLGL